MNDQSLSKSFQEFVQHYFVQFLFFLFVLIWIFSITRTDDLENWIIENLLVFIFLPILIITRKKLHFSSISYLFIFLFLTLHITGSIYAYSSVPLGFNLQELFHLKRNPYDRIVHFSFGFLMSLPLYDLLSFHFNVTSWRRYIMPVEIILSLSAFFELIEWFIGGVLMPGSEKTYVGTQGDIWDAQKDMGIATFGAILTMLFLFISKKKIKNKGIVKHH